MAMLVGSLMECVGVHVSLVEALLSQSWQHMQCLLLIV